MLCFRFPKLSQINYLYLDNKIKDKYNNLFKLILKSDVMKKVMNIDEDASQFKYPFDDEEIIKELEKNTFLVPFPAKNFYGYSDRAAFKVYINSYIKSSNFKSIFIDIDNITKSKCHEVKHMYRLYIHINKPSIELKTPEINKDCLGKYKLLKKNKNFIKEHQNLITGIYSNRGISKNESKNLDYRDILEFAINGDKQDVFLLKTLYFV